MLPPSGFSTCRNCRSDTPVIHLWDGFPLTNRGRDALIIRVLQALVSNQDLLKCRGSQPRIEYLLSQTIPYATQTNVFTWWFRHSLALTVFSAHLHIPIILCICLMLFARVFWVVRADFKVSEHIVSIWRKWGEPNFDWGNQLDKFLRWLYIYIGFWTRNAIDPF